MSKSARGPDPHKKRLLQQLIHDVNTYDDDEQALATWWSERGHDPRDIERLMQSALVAAAVMGGMKLTAENVATALSGMLMLGYKLGALDTEELMREHASD